MSDNTTVQSAKRTMLIGMLLLLCGGIAFIVLSLATKEFIGAAAVAWGCGAGTAIYSAGRRAITALESELATKE